MSNDEIIAYGLNHEDEKVRDLARRFQDYRETVLRRVRAGTRTWSPPDYGPQDGGPEDVPMFLKKQAS